LLSAQSNARVIATVLVGLIVVLALVGYGYVSTSSRLSSMSEQNTGLSQQLSGLGQQVSVLEQRTLTVVTVSNTITEVLTTTSLTTTTDLVTSTVYPIPDNVTVSLIPAGEFTSYSITAGSYSTSGSSGSLQRFSVSPVFQGETIVVSIILSCPGATGPSASALLYVNSTLVSQTNVACGGNTNGQISYVL